MYSWNQWPAIIATGVFLISTPSLAQSTNPVGSYYGGITLGTATFFDEGGLEYDLLGFVVAAQFGYRIAPDIRVEGELAYESTSAEIGGTNIDVDVTVVRPSVSAYYDFNVISLGGLTPYVGGGVGISFIDFDVEGVGGLSDDEELSAHIEGGGSLKVGANLDIIPAARWELTDDASNFQFRVSSRLWF